MDIISQLRSARPAGASSVHPALRSSAQCIQRFDGSTGAVTAWDSLRRDEELWLDDGDCTVHFSHYGASRRGPSLRICLEDVEKSQSSYLLKHCVFPGERDPSPTSDDSGSDSGYSSSKSSDRTPSYTRLFVPAPADLARNDTHAYHVGTRNYFAFLLGRPLVGVKLGSALIDLWDRIQLWQPSNARVHHLFSYCEEQGYLDFTENPTYALAALQLAEETGTTGLWMDAFTHCVGMRHRLDGCPERRELSTTTYALISRASLDMEQHVTHVTRALGEFLEQALGPEFLGLAKPARDHLDRFRSFCHAFYVDKLGYFPPDENDCWNHQTWLGMYLDFQSLYEYMADLKSSHDLTSTRGNHGGICVIQNLQAFDERHGFARLPHPLPLLPDIPVRRRTIDAQIGLKPFRLGRTDSIRGSISDSARPLEQAPNSDGQEAASNAFVREYMRFERLKLDERITVVEARKVRWLLVYGMLQMLISITRAPDEVTDVDSSSYPLCLSTDANEPWIKASTRLTRRRNERMSGTLPTRPSTEGDRISIHPDCEADSAGEYFSKQTISRSNSDHSISMAPPPLRVVPALSRTASIRSSVQTSVNSLQRSVLGSLSRRNSNRRSLIFPSLNRVTSFISIMPEDGVPEADISQANELPAPATPSDLDEYWPERPAASSLSALVHDTNREPILENHQLDVFDEGPLASPVDSEASTLSHSATLGSKSSSVLDFCDSPISEPSSVDENDDLNCASRTRNVIDPTLAAFDFDFHPAPTPHSIPLHSSTSTKTIPSPNVSHQLNVSCYTPSGAMARIPSRVSSLHALNPPRPAPSSLLSVPQVLRSESFSSVASSSGSSVYPETSQQAAEIEEEETRGRRRVRGLDRLPTGFGRVDARFFQSIVRLR